MVYGCRIAKHFTRKFQKQLNTAVKKDAFKYDAVMTHLDFTDHYELLHGQIKYGLPWNEVIKYTAENLFQYLRFEQDKLF
jgi:hypothetical protein